MQGRLLPPTAGRFQCFPRGGWADEFPFAAKAGLDCIEWIYDDFGADVNPIATDSGVESMLELSDRHGICVASVCADVFMERPLVRVSPIELEERVDLLLWLIERAERLSMRRIVLPFVDASRIETDVESEQVVDTLLRTVPRAMEAGLELHLETSLGPSEFASLLAPLPPDVVKVNYDIGNSASLGYDPREEFAAYGDRVGSVHVKDRVRGGSTVPLGSGNADLPAVFANLGTLGYTGDVVLQVARGVPGDEISWAEHNRNVVEQHLAGAAARS